jgi:hypothetical protein
MVHPLCSLGKKWLLGVGLASVLLVSTLSQEAAADVASPAGKMQLFQQEQAVRREHMLVRPTPQEREAVKTLINMKPRPKTFTEADMKYLKGLLGRAAWMGGEQRIVHEMWTEGTGKQWEPRLADHQPQPEGEQ